MEFLSTWAVQTWGVLVQAGPWLLGGFILAGFIHAYLPMGKVARHLGAPRLAGVLKASLIGVPLPLCSCSVIPVAAALRKQGASRGATAAFLVSTPETGVDSISISYALLGPFLAVLRPIAAFVTAMVAGCTINWFTRDPSPSGRIANGEERIANAEAGRLADPSPSGSEGHDGCTHAVIDSPRPVRPTIAPQHSCCSRPVAGIPTMPVDTSACGESGTASRQSPSHSEPALTCCGHTTLPAATPAVYPDTHRGGSERWHRVVRRLSDSRIARALRYGLSDMFADLGHWLLLGFALAGLISALVPPGLLERYIGEGPLAYLVTLAVALPLYVCATSSTPVAAALIAKGLSPGAAVVFLLAGPASNAATMVIVARMLGRRALALYLASIVITAVLFGVATDALLGTAVLPTVTTLHHHHAEAGGGAAIAAVVLIGLMFTGVVRRMSRSVAPLRAT